MDSKIISRIHTREEQNMLLAEINLLSKSLYHTGEYGWDNCIAKSVRSWVAGIINNELNAGNIDKEKYLRELFEQVKQLKVIKICIGVEPSEEMMQKISLWTAKNMGEGWIVEVEVDKKVLGGAKIAINGKYIDASLASNIDKLWLENKDELLKKAGVYAH